MKRPTSDQIETAILWLESNEGDGQEGEACRAVAKWIEHLDALEFARKVARAAGVTVTEARRVLRERK